MKISLTKKELLSILTQHFGQDVSECVIVKGPSALSSYLERRMTEKFGKPRFEPGRKIEAIKYLREIIHDQSKETLGLADAKWACENWNRWIVFIQTFKRMPVIKFDPSSFLNVTLA